MLGMRVHQGVCAHEATKFLLLLSLRSLVPQGYGLPGPRRPPTRQHDIQFAMCLGGIPGEARAWCDRRVQSPRCTEAHVRRFRAVPELCEEADKDAATTYLVGRVRPRRDNLISRSKGHFPREAKFDAEHELLGGNIADLVEVSLPFHLSAAGLEADANLLLYPADDLLDGGVAVGLRREAVDVDGGQLGPCARLEEVLVAVVEAAEVVEELYGRRGQVHDEVGDGRGYGDVGRLGTGCLGGPGDFDGGLYYRAVAAAGCLEDEIGGFADEFVAVAVGGLHELGDLVVMGEHMCSRNHQPASPSSNHDDDDDDPGPAGLTNSPCSSRQPSLGTYSSPGSCR